MAPQVEQVQRFLSNFRAENEARFPRVRDLSDMELARKLKKVKNTNVFDNYIGSHFFTRKAGKLSLALEPHGQRAEELLADIGLPGVGRGANFIIQSSPEMLSGLASSFVKGPSTALRVATLALPALLAGFRAAAETGKRGHVIGSALSVPAGFLGAAHLAKPFAKMVGAPGSALARAAGGVLGGTVGDSIEIGAHPGLGDNPLERAKNFFGDKTNLVGYAVAQLPFAGVDYLVQKGQNIAQTVEAKREAIKPAFDEADTEAKARAFMKNHGLVEPEGTPKDFTGSIVQRLQKGEITESEAQLRLFERSPELTQEISEEIPYLKAKMAEESKSEALLTEERQFSLATQPKDELFSLKTTTGDSFFQNNLLVELQKATRPRVEGGIVKAPEIIVKPEGKITGKITDHVSGKAVSQLLGKWGSEGMAKLPGMSELIKELSGKKRITVNELWKKFVDVMPEVRVRTLTPRQPLSKEARAALDLKISDSDKFLTEKGYGVITDKQGTFTLISGPISNLVDQAKIDSERNLTLLKDVPDDVIEAFKLKTEEGFGDLAAVTGRYGNEPLPLNKMDRPVDIVVKDPNITEHSMGFFGDPHFDPEGEGIIVSSRGFFHNPDTFVVFENQSTAGQARRKEVEAVVRSNSDIIGEKFIFGSDGESLIPESSRGKSSLRTPFIVFPHEADRLGLKVGDEITTEKVRKVVIEISTFNQADHPLFSVYNSLGIKAAINHAKNKGAKHIVFLDAETAMMIQRHDEGKLILKGPKVEGKKDFVPFKSQDDVANYISSLNLSESLQGAETRKFREDLIATKRIDETNLSSAEIQELRKLGFTFLEEGGMRLNYDEKIPKEVSRLTKDKGKKVVLHTLEIPSRLADKFGVITDTKSKVFKDKFGPKSSATGIRYDISKINPDEFRLFSLYDSANQSILEARVNLSVEEALADAEYIAQDKFIKSVIPTNFKADEKVSLVLANWLGSMITDKTKLRLFNLDPVQGVIVKGFNEKLNQIGVNLAQTAEGAYGTVGHEFSHVALHELAKRSPDDIRAIREFVHDFLGPDGMRALLTDLQKLTKTEDYALDIDYLTGLKFAQTDPDARLKTTYEFIAGVNELLTIHEYRQATNVRPAQLDSFISLLPHSLQRQIRLVADKLRQWFGPHYPSMAHVLGDVEKQRVFKMLDLMSGTIIRNDTAQRKAYELLGNTDRFNPDGFIASLPYGLLSQQEGNDPNITHLPPNMRMYSKATIDQQGVGLGIKYFMSGLFRAQLYPFTMPIFESLKDTPRLIQDRIISSLAIFGQGPEGSKGPAEDNRIFQNLMNRYNSGPETRRIKIGKVIHEIQERRASGNPTLTNDQMRAEYGLTDEDVNFVTGALKMTELISKNRLVDMTDRDLLKLASIIFSRSKKTMAIKDAQEIASRFTNFGNELGFHKIRINELKTNISGLSENTPNRIAKTRELESLQSQEVSINQLTEKTLRQVLKDQVELNPELGKDGHINTLIQVMRNQGYARMKYALITSKPEYAPRVRRRRFIVLVYDRDESGNVNVLPDVSRDFNKEPAARKYADSQQNDNIKVDVLDQHKPLDRYEYLSTEAIKDLMLETNTEFNDLITKYKNETPDGPAKDDIIATLTSLSNDYQPLQSDMRDAISIRGDRFTERRRDVSGMREEDYVNNIFDYLTINTAVGRKQITRAFTDLYLLQPEFDQNPQLKALARRDRDYTLNSSKGEANAVRRFIFYFYLGASPRHIAQNAFQIFTNGISEMVSRNGGYIGSYNKMFKAMNLSAQYVLRGTSGDSTIDGLLKSADLNGVTHPNHLEAFLPESNKSDAALHLTALYGDGNSSLLDKPKWAAHVAGVQLGKFLRSTSAFSETVNRRISYVMGVLHGQEQGVTDPQALFRMGQEFSDSVNFVGSKASRPGVIISLADKPILHSSALVSNSLRSFTINHISQLAKFWMEGKIGSYDVIGKTRRDDKGPFSLFGGSFNPKNPASRALIVGMGHLLAVSGTMGLLLAHDMDQLMEFFTGFSFQHWLRKGIIGPDKALEIEEDSGNMLADIALGGIPALFGMDTSYSLGLGRLADFSAGRPATVLNNPIIGPIGGIIQKAGEAIKAIARDPADPNNWGEAVRNISPAALTYWLRMTDAAVRNQYLDRQMRPVTDHLKDLSALPLSLGFTPLEVSHEQRRYFGAKRDEKRQDQEKRVLVNSVGQLLYDYKQTKDPLILAKAQQRFANYQTKAPGALYDKRSLLESISLSVRRYTAPEQQTPSLAHQRIAKAHSDAYPGVKVQAGSRFSAAIQEIQVSQLLGQSDVATEQYLSLQRNYQNLILSDRLLQKGLPPALVELLKSQRIRDRIRAQALMSN